MSFPGHVREGGCEDIIERPRFGRRPSTGSTENGLGASTRPGQLFFPVGRKDTEGGIGETTIEKLSDQGFVFFVFKGFQLDTHKIARGFDEFLFREQTVLRLGIAGSENSRDATACRGGGHEEDGAVRTFCFFESCIPGRVPHDPGIADRLRGCRDIDRACALSVKGASTGKRE